MENKLASSLSMTLGKALNRMPLA